MRFSPAGPQVIFSNDRDATVEATVAKFSASANYRIMEMALRSSTSLISQYSSASDTEERGRNFAGMHTKVQVSGVKNPQMLLQAHRVKNQF